MLKNKDAFECHSTGQLLDPLLSPRLTGYLPMSPLSKLPTMLEIMASQVAGRAVPPRQRGQELGNQLAVLSSTTSEGLGAISPEKGIVGSHSGTGEQNCVCT